MFTKITITFLSVFCLATLVFAYTSAFPQAQNILPQDTICLQPSEISLNHKSIGDITKDTIPKKTIACQNESEALTNLKITERADSAYMRGEKDAKRYYVDYRKASYTVFVVTAINPVYGLASAIVFANIPLSKENLGYPDTVLFKNPRYQNGYKHKAKQIKVKKVWKSFGVVMAIDLCLFLVVAYAITGFK